MGWSASKAAAAATSNRPAAFARALAAALVLLLAACAQSKPFLSAGQLPERSGTVKVLLMPPDVELSEITAAGLHEPNAAWTATAKGNVEAALAAIFAERSARLVPYRSLEGDARIQTEHLQAVKLHSTVGTTILVHKYLPAMALPTKKDRFDWSLGESATVLAKSFEADYALFVYLRDSFASSGRVAVIVVAALFGASVPGGQQVGFASLVDLRSGDIVWFNRLVKGTGDLRKPDLARAAADELLDQFPL